MKTKYFKTAYSDNKTTMCVTKMNPDNSCEVVYREEILHYPENIVSDGRDKPTTKKVFESFKNEYHKN